MDFHLTKFPLIAARVYWLNILLAFLIPPIIEVNFIITILTIRDLYWKMEKSEQKNVRVYLLICLSIHIVFVLAIAIVSSWIYLHNITEIPEPMTIWMGIGMILMFILFGLMILFLYYFQTRLNTLEDFEGVDLFDLLFTPWFLQRWSKILTN